MLRTLLTLLSSLMIATASLSAETHWLAGFARFDISPQEPVRMAGYGSRDHASEGMDMPLYARAIAIQHPSADRPSLLVSVDNIGLPGDMTRELVKQLCEDHDLLREQIVVCSTHTHCGPDLVSELSNIFSTDLSKQEREAGLRYRRQLMVGLHAAADRALAKQEPVSLHYAVGEVDFAANRRVLKDGRWSGFGVQSDGPVDHSVPTLRFTGSDGKVRGVVFNYACHCTTLGGNYYRINGEWAGYASMQLESEIPGCVALCTIGCGADANPNPRGTLDATKIHGRAMAAEIKRVLASDMSRIDQSVEARYDYAALPFDLPTQEELESRRETGDAQTRRHAEHMLQVLREHGRLPATYPVPIQTWQFGSQLTMVFLGGEVVVDYALRLEDELDNQNLWVTAYANDVLGYIASERMRIEGGYEYDRSGIYYNLPGPWAGGTEDLLIGRIHEVLKSRGRSKPTQADQSLQKFQLTDGYRIELVAAEPLVQDPINMAFDQHGRLWIVEMGDYPEGENGGKVKVLSDDDGDGRFDRSSTFLDELPFPTGVFPWRDGVLISAAPDILFARDTDGDDKADVVEKRYTGFRLANPQHRISGFTYGLDHSLHLSSGDNLSEISSVATGNVVNASGHDVQIWPDDGRIAVTSGRTQYIRSRNDWGQWFGNDNSRPMYHFPIEDHYLRRNNAVAARGGTKQLFDPPVAPPIFPVTAATERFNDLFAANRFTSACSAIIARSPVFEFDDGHDVAFICEPVHNLIHRAMIVPEGSSYRAERHEAEQQREFLASSDPWFRPVRALIAPDGSLYIADMYREVIEHPEWIPETWQAQLDLRAGADRGRIYRITRHDSVTSTDPIGRHSANAELVDTLRSPVGARRDLAQQWLVERNDPNVWPTLKALANDPSVPHAQIHALSILRHVNELEPSVLLNALDSTHIGVLIQSIRLSESMLTSREAISFLEKLDECAEHTDARVRLQVALSLGESHHPSVGKILAKLARSGDVDSWMVQAITTSSHAHAHRVLDVLFEGEAITDVTNIPSSLLTNLLITTHAAGVDLEGSYGHLFDASTRRLDNEQQLALAACFTAALRTRGVSDDPMLARLKPLYDRALQGLRDPNRDETFRKAAMDMVGIGIGSREAERSLLLELVSPQTPIQLQQAAIDRLADDGDVRTCDQLIERWPAMTDSARGRCVGKILQRRSWTVKLLDALENGQIQTSDLSPAARQQLSQTGSRSMRVRASRLVATNQSLAKHDLINHYEQQMASSGDLSRGKALFKKHCAVCHVADEHGAAVGASLENLVDRRAKTLLTAIIDPNQAVDPKFQSYIVRTDEDRILMGTIEQESSQSLTLAHADGKRTTVRRDSILEIKNSGVSLMPEGLQEVLPPDDMRDVIEYLQQL